jgi:hypothetical protein
MSTLKDKLEAFAITAPDIDGDNDDGDGKDIC